MKTYALKVCDVEHAHSSLHPIGTIADGHRVRSPTMKLIIQSYCYSCANTGKPENHNPNKPLHFREWKYKMVVDPGFVIYRRQCFQTWESAWFSARAAWPRVAAMTGSDTLVNQMIKATGQGD